MKKLKQWYNNLDGEQLLEVAITAFFCLFGLWICWVL